MDFIGWSFCLEIGDERGMWEEDMGMAEGLEMVDLKRVKAGLEIERHREAIGLL